MTSYEYKVTPAPKRLKRVRGVRSTAELFSMTLAEAINAAARDGWEYVRAESLPATEEGGWFRRPVEVIETVLIFRRLREGLGPRLAVRTEPAGHDPEAIRVGGPSERPVVLERPVADRAAPPLARREPRLGEPQFGEPDPPRPAPRLSGAQEAATPLRPTPRLGPADPP